MSAGGRWIILILLLLPTPAVAQLRDVGFAPGDDPPPARRIAVTIDDLPWVGRVPEDSIVAATDRLLATVIGWRIPVVGFVNEVRLKGREAQHSRTHLLRLWLASGVELANHTYGHLSADSVSLADYQADILRGERIARALSSEHGRPFRFFRHPYLRTGPDTAYRYGVERFLAAHGYRIAPVTIETFDWVFARAYERAERRGDLGLAKQVGAAYLTHLDGAASFFENCSRDLLGYEPAQILLIHANRLNADYLGAVLSLFRRRGYRFVSLEEALRDTAYSLVDGYVGSSGPAWLHRWAVGLGKEPCGEPREPEWIRVLAAP